MANSGANNRGLLEYWKSILGLVVLVATIFGFLGKYIWQVPIEEKNNIAIIKETLVNLKESSEKNYNAQELSIKNLSLSQDRTNLTLEKFMTSVNLQLDNQNKMITKLEEKVDKNAEKIIELEKQIIMSNP